jgi:hypothetical protein
MKNSFSPFTKGNTNKACVSFVDSAFEFAQKHNKTIEFRNVNYLLVNRKEQCTGYCDDDGLVVAYKENILSAFKTFVHEFCHLQQSVEDIKGWKEWHWPSFDGNLSIPDYQNLKKCIELEHDCERRAIKYIKELNIVDVEEYIQEANSYFFFQQYCFLKRKWFPLKCGNEDIYAFLINSMPTKLVPVKSFSKIDMDVMNMFEIVFCQ